MRKPFVVSGYRVTDDTEDTKGNMEAIAKWCEGNVVRNTERPFVRVPVNRPTNKKQTEAYDGTWVLLSYTPRGEKSFKVYSAEWLEKNFLIVPEEGFKTRSLEWIEKNLLSIPDEDEALEVEGMEDTTNDKLVDNVLALPTPMNMPTTVREATT